MNKEERDKKVSSIVADLEDGLDRYFELAFIDEDGSVQQRFEKGKVGPGRIKDWRITINPSKSEHGVPHFHANSVQRKNIGVSFTLDGKCEPCDGDIDKLSGKDIKIIKAFYKEYKTDFDEVYALMSQP